MDDSPVPRGTDPASGRLTRPRRGRLVAGVAVALARRMDVDVALVRLGFVLTTFFGGFGLIAYLAAWALLPSEGAESAPAERWFGKNSPRR